MGLVPCQYWQPAHEARLRNQDDSYSAAKISKIEPFWN